VGSVIEFCSLCSPYGVGRIVNKRVDAIREAVSFFLGNSSYFFDDQTRVSGRRSPKGLAESWAYPVCDGGQKFCSGREGMQIDLSLK